MTAAEFLKAQAERFGFLVTQAGDSDYDIRPGGPALHAFGERPPESADLMSLLHVLQKHEFMCYFPEGSSVHVHAPHRKLHEWDDRGWNCDVGCFVEGCEALRKK